jgi:tetratricopeptide (TPR) repeat protein
MRAALPVGDPERLKMSDVPELRPWLAEDEADIEAMKNEVVVRKVTPRPLRPEAVEWLLAADAYVRAWPGGAPKDPSRAVAVAFQAAELLYKHRHFDPNPALATDRTPAAFWSARERFWWIIKQHPKSRQAPASFNGLLTSYGIENDIANLQIVVQAMDSWYSPRDRANPRPRFSLHSPGAERLWETAESMRKAAARMTNPDEAGKQFAESREYYEQAGDKFRHLRADATDTKTKLGALMWGMESFRRAEKWDKCLDVLNEAEEMIRGVKAADEAERKENLKRLDLIITTRALLHYRFFEVEDAIADYRLLYETNPDGARASEYLKSAADLASYNGDWDLAVKLDETFVAKFGRNPKKRGVVQQTAWRIQQSWQKKGNSDRQLKALEAFIARFAKDELASTRVFQAYSLIGDIYETRGDRKNADRTWSRTLVAFQRGGYAKNGGAEATAAAQASFKQLESRYTQVMTTKLVIDPRLRPIGQARRLLGQLGALWDLVLGPEKQIAKPDGTLATARGGGLYDEYETVLGFGSREWSPAASLYRARLLQHLARVLYEMPVPDKLPPKEEESFGLTVAAIVGKPFEDRALRLLETALNDADAKGVANRWVTELRKEINRYKPKQYPLLKEEKRLLLARPGPLPFVPAPAATDGSERATAEAGVRAALGQARAGDLPAALATAAKDVQADPTHSRAVVLWSVLLLRAGDTQAALKAVDAALASRPTDVMLLNAKVRVLTSSGEFAKAREVTIRAQKLDHTNPETLLDIAEIDLARGREGLANLALDRAFSVYAGDADDDDGEDADGEPDPVRKAYDVRVAQGGGDLRGTGAETLGRDAGMSRIYVLYGRISLGRGEAANARELFEQAVRLRPDDAEAWNNLGVCWLAARKGDDAVAALSKALELEPNLLEAHVNLGSAYRFATDPDRVMKARAEFELVIRQAPRTPEPYFNLGILYLENAMPDLQSNEQRYQKAIELFAAYRDARGAVPGPVTDPVDDYVAEAVHLRRLASQAGKAPEEVMAEERQRIEADRVKRQEEQRLLERAKTP